MPPDRSYLPVFRKSDRAFVALQDHVEDKEEDSPTTNSSIGLSEPSLTSPGISHNTASSSSPHSLPWQDTILTPIKAFHMLEDSKEGISLLTPSAPCDSAEAEGFNLPLLGQVKWEDLKKAMKVWLKNPKNLAVSLWGLAVGVSGALLFLVMVGLLDRQLPSKVQRDAWFEVNNQILNALFTMMCLFLHPQRFLHLIMLFRWHPQDISKLRQVYCKYGTYKPREWRHMLVVVVLLHINCFSQYALCGLNWGFKRSQRPPVGVGLCLALAIGSPAAAGIYSMLSPLGRNIQPGDKDDVQMQEAKLAHKAQLGRTPSLRFSRVSWMFCGDLSFASKDGALIDEPKWRGELFDCCQDPTVAVLSTVCPFCVFGWNMERLGFGNRYVHIVTFMLVCTAPYWILTLASINIDNVHVRKGLGISGILLSIFGLLYGGFWRIQMRKTFNLPATRWCFGKAILTDCMQWLFCSLCSLCQEVRTSEFYRIRESNFYEREALSEISSVGRRSSGVFEFGIEASSPVPFRNFSPTSLSFSAELGAASSGNSNLNGLEDGRIRVLYMSGDQNPMDPPVPQVLHDRNSNFHMSSISAANTDLLQLFNANPSPNNAKTFNGSQQKSSHNPSNGDQRGNPDLSYGNHVLQDRSNIRY